MKGDEIFRACHRHSVETVTLSKCVAEYENVVENVHILHRIYPPQSIDVSTQEYTQGSLVLHA